MSSSIIKVLLLTFLSNAIVRAAQDCSSIKIQSEADVNSYASCSEAGKITIGPNVEKISIDGIKKADSIEALKSENLKSVSFSNLNEIDSLHIENNKALESLNFPKLQNSKSISVIGNPVLSNIKLSLKKAGSIEFTNNGISKIEGLELEQVNSLTIQSNPNLDKFQSKVEKMEGYLYVSGNSPKLALSLSNLQSIGGNVTISNCTSVDLSKLSSIDNMVNIVGNHFQSFVANNLSTVSSSFSFVSNDKVKELSLDGLTSIGGALLISNNTELETIKFEKLEELKGTLDVTGDFKSLELPSLNMISGGANIQSKDGSLECDKLNNVKSITNGKFTCEGKVKDPKSKTSTNSTKPESGNSSGAKLATVGSSIGTIALGVAVVFFN